MNMSKKMRAMACLCLGVGMLQGCAPAAAGKPAARQISYEVETVPFSATSGQGKTTAPTASEQAVQVFLPSTHAALADVMAQMAGQEGFALQIETATPGVAYGARLESALASDAPPALFWLDSPVAALPMLEKEALWNMAGTQASYPLRGLTAALPEGMHLQGEAQTGQCYGLPVGYYASGTIANVELLAHLLGTEDTATLTANLYNCSWQEWQIMADALQSYLSQPRRLAFTLNGTSYTTPRFRPEEAQALRGLFALQTEGNYIVQGGLEAAVASVYTQPAQWADATPGDIQDNLAPALDALAQMLKLESASMVGAEGLVPRGEGFSAQAAVTGEQLQKLMGTGKVLFARGDSATAVAIQKAYPATGRGLVMIPVKMPLPEETSERINTQLQVGTQGYLCISSGASEEDKARAEQLLIRLFASSQGLGSIRQTMQLVPFSAAVPVQGVPAQVAAAALQGKAYMLPMGPFGLQKQTQNIGLWVLKNLLTKEEWQEEDIDAFMGMALKEFGVLSYEKEEPDEE